MQIETIVEEVLAQNPPEEGQGHEEEHRSGPEEEQSRFGHHSLESENLLDDVEVDHDVDADHEAPILGHVDETQGVWPEKRSDHQQEHGEATSGSHSADQPMHPTVCEYAVLVHGAKFDIVQEFDKHGAQVQQDQEIDRS